MRATKPCDVTIVITSFNNSLYIEKAICSAHDAAGDIPHEVIVVDDHSTDSSWDLLHSLKDRYSFRLERTPHNLGPSAARNLGIKLARGRYINFLDGDDYLLPGKIQPQLQALKASPEAAACYTDCLIEQDGEILPIKLSDQWPIPGKTGAVLTSLLYRSFIALHSVLMPTDLAQKILFDESLRQAEDYDFWLRTATANDYFIFLPEARCVYRRVSNSLSVSGVPAADFALRVLVKMEQQPLKPQQRRNLYRHKRRILLEKSDVLLHQHSPLGLASLKEANQIRILSPDRLLALLAMRQDFTRGLRVYFIINRIKSKIRKTFRLPLRPF